jgi:hypothetical protein
MSTVTLEEVERTTGVSSNRKCLRMNEGDKTKHHRKRLREREK